MNDATTKALKTWTVEGTTEDGAPSTTLVTIERNPDWTREDADFQCRYSVTKYVDGDCEDVDGADSKAEAVELAEEWAQAARDDYATTEADRREARSDALKDACADWAGGDDASAVEAVAFALLYGKGALVLDALRKAGLAD